MKIARQDTLPRQDSLFQGGEPEDRYKMRQMVVVSDDYDFITNNSTDITTVENLKLVYGLSMIDYVTYIESLKTLYTSLVYNNLSDIEKKILCENFIVNKDSRDEFFNDDSQKELAFDNQQLIMLNNIDNNIKDNINNIINDVNVSIVSSLPNYKELYITFDGKNNGVWHKVTLDGISPNSIVMVTVYSNKKTRYGGVREVGSSLDRKKQIESQSSFTLPVKVDHNKEIEVYRQTSDINFVVIAQLS